jgi:putative hydrolase of the HAD superfamily
MSEPRIRGVTFDWWHTIAETPWPDYDARLRSLRIRGLDDALSEAGLVLDRSVLSDAYDRHTEFLETRWRKMMDVSPDRQVDAFLRFVGIDSRDPSIREAVGSAFGEAIRSRLPILYPNIESTLTRLRAQGYRIGLVSNTGRTWGRYLRPIQDELGVGKDFDVRVFSDEVGWRKPRREIFQRALDGLELPPEAVVHVGDDVTADVAGAKAIRMRSIWFNTGFWSGARTDDADAEIRDHADVEEVLARWRP